MKSKIEIISWDGSAVELDLKPNSNPQALCGEVYIFENYKAQRVKVGMTTSDVQKRLREVRDKWMGLIIRCQICGTRLQRSGGRLPNHSGCPGGGELPLEKDVTLAETYLEDLKNRYSKLTGSKKGSLTNKINNLEKRIELYRNYERPIGGWRLSTSFYTEHVDQVERLAHVILAEHLAESAPFGEVFCCSVSEATSAIEKAKSQLKLT